jgi:hypothetical protein
VITPETSSSRLSHDHRSASDDPPHRGNRFLTGTASIVNAQRVWISAVHVESNHDCSAIRAGPPEA